MAPLVHPRGICESDSVGDGTRIWAFAHVLPGAVIGRDCNVCDHVFIENDVRIGDRVTIKSGVQLWDGMRIADDVFIGPNATFTNDPSPRSKEYPERFAETVIGPGASIGANATVLPGLRIGRNAMVGAGSVVTKDVPPNAIVVGNPANITGYAQTLSQSRLAEPMAAAPASESQDATPTVRGVRIHRLTRADDLRGKLVAAELGAQLPFVPQRFFAVFDVPSREVRGEHAHRACEQFLICLSGSVSVMVDDGRDRKEFLLNSPDVGVHLAPLVWGVQYKYSADAVLLVFASHPYDPDDYIRDYEEFLALSAPSSPLGG